MKGGSVLAHVTDWNDDADEESAPNGEQKARRMGCKTIAGRKKYIISF